MLHVTPRARDELRDLLVQALAQRPTPDAEEIGFRLVSESEEPTELHLALDAPRDGDAVIEHEGRSLLIVDAPTAEVLRGLTLDVEDGPEGRRLSIRD